jgi:hypothetical protein
LGSNFGADVGNGGGDVAVEAAASGGGFMDWAIARARSRAVLYHSSAPAGFSTELESAKK